MEPEQIIRNRCLLGQFPHLEALWEPAELAQRMAEIQARSDAYLKRQAR